jgi:uncharacterized membrane protein
MELNNLLIGGGIVSTGLVSGLLYGWTVSVIPGLRRTTDLSYVTTMQQINQAIINPAFVIPFMGIPLVLGAAAFVQFRAGDTRRGWLLASATLTYVVAVLGVTVGRNVPLNDALDAFVIERSDTESLATRRHTYEQPWNRWHNLRTLGSIASFALTAAAALVAADSD